MMRKRALTLLFAILISAPAAAQKEPAEVTDAEIAKYKTSSEAECRTGAAGKGDPKDIEAFCGCMFASLNASMTRAEWQQAYFYTTKNDAAHVREVLAPHMQKAECRPKAAEAQPPAAEAQPAPKPKPPSQGLRPPSK